jgi:hypothetical protein
MSTDTKPKDSSPQRALSVYVDQLARMQNSPFVTKLSFSVIASDGKTQEEILEIVMPTYAAMQLSRSIESAISQLASHDTFKHQLAEVAEGKLDATPLGIGQAVSSKPKTSSRAK